MSRQHTADCYTNGCRTGTHPAPRPGHVTGGPWTPEEVLTAPDYTEADWSWDDHDTTVGQAPELTEQERARLNAIEAADPAPESLRERVAVALQDAAWAPDGYSALDLADAALAVIKGDPS